MKFKIPNFNDKMYLKPSKEEIKHIRKLQLEYLKTNKIKSYGLSHEEYKLIKKDK